MAAMVLFWWICIPGTSHALASTDAVRFLTPNASLWVLIATLLILNVGIIEVCLPETFWTLMRTNVHQASAAARLRPRILLLD
jgi:hypothetical protein